MLIIYPFIHLNYRNVQNTAIPAHDRSVTPVIQNIDSNLCYFPSGYTSPYYFGGKMNAILLYSVVFQCSY